MSRQANTRRGIVLSDLHLFARRSRGMACFASVRGRLGSMDVLVLNGDTFDFRWSTLRNEEETLDAAQAWLQSLLDEFPNCQVHLILGNHDCLNSFEARLGKLATTRSRFQWHECCLRLGPILFLHGDCAVGEMDAVRLRRYREVWKQHGQRGRLSGAAYSYTDQLGVTQLFHRWYFPRRRTVRRIAYYLDHLYPDWRGGTRDCYFGHTHLPFSHHLYDGIRFHNTGSAIRHMAFNPIVFDASAPARLA